MKRLFGRVTRGAVLDSLCASATIQAGNMVTGVLLARSLGVHGRGELAAVILWPTMLAAIGSLGNSDAATYYSARGTYRAGAIVGSGVALALAESCLLIGAGVALLPAVLSRYGSGAIHMAQLFLAFVPLNIVTLVFFGVLGGAQRFGRFQMVRLAPVAIALLGIGGVAAVDRLTVGRVAAIYIAANVITLIMAARLMARSVALGRLTVDRETVRALLSFGVRSHLGNVSSTLNSRMDQLLISAFLSPTKLGLYVVAVTLGSATSLVGSSVALIALPRTAGASPEARRQLTRRLSLQVGACSVAVTLPIFAFAPMLLSDLFGAEFAGAGNVARVLLVASVIYGVSRVLGGILTGFGQPLDQGVGELVALSVTAASLAILLPRFGLIGAAAASLLAYSVSFAWMVMRLRRRLAESPAVQVALSGRSATGALE